VNALACADDPIFIMDSEGKLKAMRKILEEFCLYLHMTVNTKKCFIISSQIDPTNGRWRALQREFGYRGEQLLRLRHEQSTLYLEYAVEGSRRERAKPAQARLNGMRDDTTKIGNSELINVQKLEAQKIFLMPTVDLLLRPVDASKAEECRSVSFT
jgi:hypothetical protein